MPLKILSIDDSKTIRIIIRNAFKRFDCEIIEAGNGFEGLEQARSKPDLILLDITMPVMDGLTMLERLHQTPALNGIPVIMLTAEGQKSSAEKAVALGSRGYLVKPFTADQLIAMVNTVVTLPEKVPAAG